MKPLEKSWMWLTHNKMSERRRHQILVRDVGKRINKKTRDFMQIVYREKIKTKGTM